MYNPRAKKKPKTEQQEHPTNPYTHLLATQATPPAHTESGTKLILIDLVAEEEKLLLENQQAVANLRRALLQNYTLLKKYVNPIVLCHYQNLMAQLCVVSDDFDDIQSQFYAFWDGVKFAMHGQKALSILEAVINNSIPLVMNIRTFTQEEDNPEPVPAYSPLQNDEIKRLQQSKPEIPKTLPIEFDEFSLTFHSNNPKSQTPNWKAHTFVPYAQHNIANTLIKCCDDPNDALRMLYDLSQNSQMGALSLSTSLLVKFNPDAKYRTQQTPKHPPIKPLLDALTSKSYYVTMQQFFNSAELLNHHQSCFFNQLQQLDQKTPSNRMPHLLYMLYFWQGVVSSRANNSHAHQNHQKQLIVCFKDIEHTILRDNSDDHVRLAK